MVEINGFKAGDLVTAGNGKTVYELTFLQPESTDWEGKPYPAIAWGRSKRSKQSFKVSELRHA